MFSCSVGQIYCPQVCLSFIALLSQYLISLFFSNHWTSRKSQTCRLHFLVAHSLLVSGSLASTPPARRLPWRLLAVAHASRCWAFSSCPLCSFQPLVASSFIASCYSCTDTSACLASLPFSWALSFQLPPMRTLPELLNLAPCLLVPLLPPLKYCPWTVTLIL